MPDYNEAAASAILPLVGLAQVTRRATWIRSVVDGESGWHAPTHPVPFAVHAFSSRLIWDGRAEVDPANRWVRDVLRRAANEVGA